MAYQTSELSRNRIGLENEIMKVIRDYEAKDSALEVVSLCVVRHESGDGSSLMQRIEANIQVK